jgi:predicted dienelactone hydrolase
MLNSRFANSLCALAVVNLVSACNHSEAADPMPSQTQATEAGLVCDGSLIDVDRGRTLPVRVRLPKETATGSVPVILFSHGLGGSTEGGTAWGEAWAEAGFAVIHVQHPGSDRLIWESEETPQARRAALQRVNFPKQLLARVEDIDFAANQIGTGQRVGDCGFADLDADRIGGAGHSFGAHTMLAAAGQEFVLFGKPRTYGVDRIKTFVVLSPSAPLNDPSKSPSAFGAITRPVFSITGTLDAQPFAPDVSPATRTSVFAGLPAGENALLVFDEADHMTFNGGELMRARSANDDRVWPLIETLTTAYFKANLLNDASARAALQPDAVRSVIGSNDDYQTK